MLKLPARASSIMAVPVPPPFSGVRLSPPRGGACYPARDRPRPCRWAAAPSISDRGDPIDKPKPAAVEKPAGTITPQNVSDAKDHATRGQVLARSGKTDEALAEFDRRAGARSLQRAGALRPRPDLSEPEVSTSRRSRISPPPTACRRSGSSRCSPAPRATSRSTRQRKPPPTSTRPCRPIRTARPAWTTRGQAYERLGDKAKAAASYGRAIALRPKDETARSGLARTGGG